MSYFIIIVVVLCIIAFIYSLIKGISFFSALGKVLKLILKIFLAIIAFFFNEAVNNSSRVANDAQKKGYSFKDQETEERFYRTQEKMGDFAGKASDLKDKL